MELKDLASGLFIKVLQVIDDDVHAVELDYSKESSVGNYGVYYLDKHGNKKMVSPGDCLLDKEQSEVLDAFLNERNSEETKCNQLIVTIKSEDDSSVKTAWNEELYQNNLRYEEALQKEKKVVSRNEVPFDRDRFQLSDSCECTQRVLSFDLTTEKIRGRFYVQLYALFGGAAAISSEGFMYSITDTRSNTSFCAGLTAFGLGYYAKEDNPEVIQIIEEFNTVLFSPENTPTDCSIEFSHDHGITKMGYAEGEVFEIEW